ncbi:MAG: ABC transporter permease [Anaerolineaceae bacterium]|jgi:putative ABC transport system permease protein
MRFWDLFGLIVYNLNRRKGRVALTAIGVIIGTAAVVVLVSLAVGLQKNATSQLYGISDLTNIEVYPGYQMEGGGGGGVAVAVGGGGGKGEPNIKMLTPTTISDIQAIPGVKQVIAQDWLQTGMDMVFGKLHSYGSITGIATADLADMGLEASQGVTTLGRGQAVIGSWVPRNFYDPKARPNDPPVEPPDLMGQSVKFVLSKWTNDGVEVKKTITVTIVGVLKETRGQADGNIYMSMDEVTAWNEWARGTRINRNKDGYSMINVRADSVDVVTDIADAINALGYQANTPQSYVEGVNSFFMVLQIIFGGVGAIALLVAAIGIANTMTMAILERTREIGLMKAVGASNKDVLGIFLGEAAGIGFLGGLGGVLIGWGSSAVLNVVALSYYASQVSQQGGIVPSMATSTPFWLPAFALAFATVIGVLSGLYPALHAASLVPVTALKYE